MSTTQKMAGNFPIGVQQHATTNFDGNAPTEGTPPTFANGTYKYEDQTKGGLFVFNTGEPVIVNRLAITIASGNITVNLVNLDTSGSPISGESWLIASATSVTSMWKDESSLKITVLQNQAIQVITTTAGYATLVYSLERTFVH